MFTTPSWVRVASLAALVGLALVPIAQAKGHPNMARPGGHGGGFHPPKMHAAPCAPAYHAPKMPHNASNMANKAPKHANIAATSTTVKPHNSTRTGSTSIGATNPTNTNLVGSTGQSHYYGTNRWYGRGRMPYRRSGYGYGRRYGSNQYNGAIISLAPLSALTLARADHDYQGHRVQAMRSIRSAIRQLSHSSSRRYGMYANGSQMFGGGMGNRNNLANRNNLNGRRGQRGRLSQAQSDALMRRAHQTLQLVGSHMSNQGGTSRMSHAYSYVNRAMQHINVALTVR